MPEAVSRTPSHCLHPPGRTQPQRQYPCAYRYQFSADSGSSVPALHGQTGRHPRRVQTPLHRRGDGILQSRSHGAVPPGKSLSNRPFAWQQNRITEREYWAQRKGQAKLDKEAAALPAEEQPAKPTKFETDKEKLRQAIRTALSSAASYGEFAAVLLQQGVTVKESRGRLSYLTPDRTKPITARKLGDDFDRAAVLALLEQNAHRAAEQTATVPEYPRNIRERLQGKKAVQTTPEKDGIQRMVDRAAKRAEGKGAGYDRWAAVHNLKQMAATVAAYGQYGYSPEELDAALVSANADLQDSTAKLKALDAAIREKKELQTQVLAYAKTKPARDGLKAQKTEKARSTYRERHESDFIIADAATRYFRAHGVSKLPSHKALQAEIEQLTAEKNAHYNEYREKKARVKELHTVKSNLSQILQGEKDREKKHEHER